MLSDGVRPPLTGETAPGACPHCGATRFNRHGRVRDLQRYRCRRCRRTFSDATGTLDARIRRRRAFRIFFAIFGGAVPVRQDAKLLGVSPSTVWRWRHRILSRLVEQHKARPKLLEGDVWIFVRTLSEPRSRWSHLFDFMWRMRRGALESPRPGQVTPGLTVICAARFDWPFSVTHPEPGRSVARLCLVYEGLQDERQAGQALLAHMTAGTRVHAPWGVGRRVRRRETEILPGWLGHGPPGAVEAIPPDGERKEETVVWTPWSEVGREDEDRKTDPAALWKAMAEYWKAFLAEELEPEEELDRRPWWEVHTLDELGLDPAEWEGVGSGISDPAGDAGQPEAAGDGGHRDTVPEEGPEEGTGRFGGGSGFEDAPATGHAGPDDLFENGEEDDETQSVEFASPFLVKTRLDGRFESAKLHWDLVGWMAKFRAVALHYVERYVAWFNGLLHGEVVAYGMHA